MCKPIGFLSALGLVFTSTIIAGSPAFAIPITYTETDTAASGSLNGVAFTDADIVLTMNNDTTNVTGGPDVFVIEGTSTVKVGAGAPATFTDLTDVAVNHTSLDIGFGDVGSGLAILFTGSSSVSAYDLKSSFGPITGGGIINSGTSFPTTEGAFILTSVGDSTFTATTAAVPAPLIGRGLPVGLIVGGVLFGVKLLKRSRKGRSLGTLGMSAT